MLPIAKTPQFPGNFTRLPCPPCARGPRLSSARGRCWAHPPGQEIQDYQQQGQQQDAAAPLHLNGATTGDYLSGFGVEGQARTGRGATAAEPDVQSNPSNSRVLGQVNSISLAQQFLAGFEAGQDAAAEAQQQDQQQQRRQEQAMDPPSNSAAQFLASFAARPTNAKGDDAGTLMQQADSQQGGAAAAQASTSERQASEQSPFCFTAPEEGQDDVDPEKILFAQTIQGPDVGSRVFPYLRAEDAWAEFEKRLEADLQTVANTLLALFAVVCYWRGVWALLDHVFGDSPLGDLVCVLMGLGIIIYIRLTGMRIGNFWPSL